MSVANLSRRARPGFRLTLVVVALSAALAVLAVPATALAPPSGTDVQPPDLTLVTLSQTRVEPGDTMTIHWEGTDDLSGIWHVDFPVLWPDRSRTLVEGIYTDSPVAGDVSFVVPADMVPGVAQIQTGLPLRVLDGVCNGWSYRLDLALTPGTPSVAAKERNNCGPGDSVRVPSLFNAADLVFGVGSDRPALSQPEKPSNPLARVDGSQLVITWDEMEPENDPITALEDWVYFGTLDGVRATATEYLPAPAWTIRPAFNIDGLTGSHEFTIWAANRFGSGPASDAFTVNLDDPNPVEHLTARGYVGHSRVSWDRPRGGQTPAGYSATTWDSVLLDDHWTNTSRGTSVRVLTPKEWHAYFVHVSTVDAENQMGAERIVTLRGTRLSVRLSTELLAGQPGRVSGHVMKNGPLTAHALPNVPVRLQRAPAADPTSFVRTDTLARTNADGHFHIDLIPRRGWVYRVVMVGQPGFAGSWSRGIVVD